LRGSSSTAPLTLTDDRLDLNLGQDLLDAVDVEVGNTNVLGKAFLDELGLSADAVYQDFSYQSRQLTFSNSRYVGITSSHRGTSSLILPLEPRTASLFWGTWPGGVFISQQIWSSAASVDVGRNDLVNIASAEYRGK
jgi:hypothetical protein